MCVLGSCAIIRIFGKGGIALKNIRFFVAVIISLTLLCSTTFANTIFVTSVGADVYVRIESYDKTLAEGVVSAFTFWEALNKLCAYADLDINLVQNLTSKEVESVNGITNNTLGKDGKWYAYIVRDGLIIEPENVLDQLLRKKDELVLYYSNGTATKKVDNMRVAVNQKSVKVSLISEYVEWHESENGMVPKTVMDRITDATLHVITPKGEKEYSVSSRGEVRFAADKAAFYSIYAEGYKKNGLPSIVKTKIMQFCAGFENDKQIKRGEFLGLLIDYYDFKMEKNNDIGFSDVTNSTKYAEQIRTARALEFVVGNGDGNFEPERPIKFAEACVILAKMLEIPQSSATTGSVEEIILKAPVFAQSSFRDLYYAGAFLGVELNFHADLNREVFNIILSNLSYKHR